MTAHGRSIGLTGNIACGKSTVSHRLEERGADVIDADTLARQLMQPPLPAWQAVVRAFGRDILRADQTIDRTKLRNIVFSDPRALQRLNDAVHPYVHAKLLQRIAENPPGHVLVIEAVAIVEAGTANELDALWLVVCPAEQQICRLMETRGLSQEDAAWRVAAQPSVAPKLALADTVIHNDADRAALQKATDTAWEGTLTRWGVSVVALERQREQASWRT